MSENIKNYLLGDVEYAYLKSTLKHYIVMLREEQNDKEYVQRQSESLSRIISKIEFFTKESKDE